MKRVVYAGVLIVLLAAVRVGADGPQCDAREWTILPVEEAAKLMRPCSRGFPAGLADYWMPSVEEVEAADRALPAAIAKALRELREGEREDLPPKYLRQDVGFLRNGERVLYVSAFDAELRDSGDDWCRHWLRTCHCQLSAFGAVYDPRKAEYDWFSFDGGLPPIVPPDDW